MLMRTQKKFLLFVLGGLLLAFSAAQSQEINCVVRVNYESVSTANKDLLRDFESDIRDYLNNYKWGADNLEEKIRCTFDINIQNVVGENRYSAQVFIGSMRPVFDSDKNSAVLRLFDEGWEFTYIKGRPINHNPYTFSDLASFLDFYVYMIIGYDYDTYIPMGGTSFFQRAADIASLGRSSGGKGWGPAKSGFSRQQLIEDILNARFANMRKASYKYHFSGLDSLATARDAALANIADAITMIGETKQGADPRNQIIKSFFDAKYLEIAELFLGYQDSNIYLTLASIDPSHQTTYEEYRRRSR